MYRVIQKSRSKGAPYVYIFVAALLLAFHYYFITYINSTFLEGFVGRNTVGIIYAVSALLNIFVFLKAASIIKKYSNYNFILVVSVIEIISLCVIALSHNPILVILSFVLHYSINPVILACLDVYLEDSSDIVHIGKLRGTFLTILGLAAVISPLAIGSLLSDGNFTYIYLFSAFFMLLFLIFVLINFRNISSGQFKKIEVLPELREFFKNKDIRNIGICSFILQFFYSWMIIYVPIYLLTVINMDWKKVALIISISLIPFILFEIPVGEIADKKLDEREILILGFGISSIALVLFPLVPAGSFALWCAVGFLARTGASIIEPSTESYFFRKTKGKDELIGVFRISAPFAFIIGPLFGSLLLFFIDFKYIFLVLSAIMLSGMFFSYRLKDGKAN